MKKNNTKNVASKVYFADAAVETAESSKTLPEKLRRMLAKFDLPRRVKDKSVAIKMHYGWGINFTTIHPLFVKILVEELKKAKAKSIKTLDTV